jgi:hypothetical protein
MRPLASPNWNHRGQPLLSINRDELNIESLRALIDYNLTKRVDVLDDFLQTRIIDTAEMGHPPSAIIPKEMCLVFGKETSDGINYVTPNDFMPQCDRYIAEKDPLERKKMLKQAWESAIYEQIGCALGWDLNTDIVKEDALQRLCTVFTHLQDYKDFPGARNATHEIRTKMQQALQSELIAPEINRIFLQEGTEFSVSASNTLMHLGRGKNTGASAMDFQRILLLHHNANPIVLHEEFDHLAVKKVRSNLELQSLSPQLIALFSDKNSPAFKAVSQAKKEIAGTVRTYYQRDHDFSNRETTINMALEVLSDIRFFVDTNILEMKKTDPALTTSMALKNIDSEMASLFDLLWKFRRDVDRDIKILAYEKESTLTGNGEKAEDLRKLMGLELRQR